MGKTLGKQRTKIPGFPMSLNGKPGTEIDLVAALRQGKDATNRWAMSHRRWGNGASFEVP